MTSISDRLASALGGSYTIERELIGGGMALVFVAEDHDLEIRCVNQDAINSRMKPRVNLDVSVRRRDWRTFKYLIASVADRFSQSEEVMYVYA